MEGANYKTIAIKLAATDFMLSVRVRLNVGCANKSDLTKCKSTLFKNVTAVVNVGDSDSDSSKSNNNNKSNKNNNKNRNDTNNYRVMYVMSIAAIAA